MKKFAVILILFFATGITVGMEKEPNLGILSLQNNLRPYPTVIECQITDINDTIKNITIPNNTKVSLGQIASIAQIKASNDIIRSHAPLSGRVNLPVVAANHFKKYDDITDLLQKQIEGYENDNFVVKVTWKHAFEWKNLFNWNKLDTCYSREWDYAFELIVDLSNDLQYNKTTCRWEPVNG